MKCSNYETCTFCSDYIPSKHLKAGHYRSASETPFEWRFTDGPMVARHLMMAGHFVHFPETERAKQNPWHGFHTF